MISIHELSILINDFECSSVDFSEYDLSKIIYGLQEVQVYQKNSYNNMWTNVQKYIEHLITRGNDFGRIIKKLLEPIPTNPLSAVSEGIMPSNIQNLNIPFNLADFKHIPGKRLAAVDCNYSLVDQSHKDFVTVDNVIKDLSSDVDCLVEFGSGWGSNLSRILMGSGRFDVKYISCEQSVGGRQCFDLLFGLLEGIDFSSHEFDFYAPNFDMIKGHNHVVAFTNAAIEQIAFLPSTFVSDLLGVAKKVTIIFYEPVGWQRFNRQQCFVVKSMFDEFCGLKPSLWHGNNFVYKIENDQFYENASSWSLRMRYNVNLLNLINKVVKNGQAELSRVEYDIYSNNPLNPYSLLALRSL